MKFFRKWNSLLLAGVMLFSLTACGQSGNASTSSSQNTPTQDSGSGTQQAETATNNSASNNTSSDGDKVLVVYYSASGNTARVAKDIADAANADVFEITPTEPYTSDDLDWTNEDSRVSKEHDDESLRDVPLTTTEVENWDQYDTVFIGYPIWWGIAAWPVDNFVKNNDFNGKTVIPFATSSSSGMGQSGDLLSQMAGTSDWQEGQRFSSGASQTEVADWVNDLKLSDK